jgi:(2Fe-2S) ferredoxin
MGKCNSTQTADFVLEGRLLGYAIDDHGHPKYLRLSTPHEYRIKLPKELRFQVYPPGEWIRVVGRSKLNRHTGEVKLKAQVILPHVALTNIAALESRSSLAAAPQRSKPETILVCQKSDCCKLGGKAVTAALQQAIVDQGLEHQVVIKGTGCMKRCKAGPNVVMPDKTRYTKIRPEAAAAIVAEHFESSPVPVPAEALVKAS